MPTKCRSHKYGVPLILVCNLLDTALYICNRAVDPKVPQLFFRILIRLISDPALKLISDRSDPARLVFEITNYRTCRYLPNTKDFISFFYWKKFTFTFKYRSRYGNPYNVKSFFSQQIYVLQANFWSGFKIITPDPAKVLGPTGSGSTTLRFDTWYGTGTLHLSCGLSLR